MKNIIYIWEYGADLEHINFFLPTAKKLREKGHNVQISIPTPAVNHSQIKKILTENKFDFFEAPSVHLEVGDEIIQSHAELMQRMSCFKTKNDFKSSFKSWLMLFEQKAPDLVVCDFAPVALLTAQQLDIPTVLFDFGFFVQETHQVLPSFIDYAISANQTIHKAPLTVAQQSTEENLLKMVNDAFSEMNFSSLKKFTDFFRTDHTLWLNRSGLLPFTNTRSAQLSEAVPSATDCVIPNWKLNRFESPKIFAYLNQDDPISMTIIQALKYHGNLDNIIYIPNCRSAIKRAYDSDNLTVELMPLNIPKILEDADLIITNFDAGLIAQALLAGKPLLLAPTSFEQHLNADRAVKLGAAISLHTDITHTSVMVGIYTLLGTGYYTVSARAFALNYHPADTETIADIISETISAPKRNHYALSQKLEHVTTS